jgi:hypothetical protein
VEPLLTKSPSPTRSRPSRVVGPKSGTAHPRVVDLRDDVDLREDEVLASLGALMDVLRRSAARVGMAEEQGERTTRQRLEGVPYREILSSAPRPLLIDMATFDLEAIATAGVRFRRAAARALLEEGMTVDQIAKEFDVSHQRVSRLLHADPDGPGPSWTSTRADRARAREESLRAGADATSRSVG